jgi:membrane protein YqaA with SNARE-associated domain
MPSPQRPRKPARPPRKPQAPDTAPLKPLERSAFTGPSHILLRVWDRVHQAWKRWAALNQHAPWFPYVVAGIVGLDAIVVILPGDVIMALATLSNPAAWRRMAILTGLASAAGSFALYLFLMLYGKAPIEHALAWMGTPASIQELSENSALQPDLEGGLAAVGASQPPKWEKAKAFYDKFGLFSLALGSLIPFFSFPPVVIAGLLSDKWVQVLVYLLIGRLLRYLILCFGLREGWAMFTTLRQEARTHKEQLEHHKHSGG